MGSGGSTARLASDAAASSSGGRRGGSRSNWGFQSSCLGLPSGSYDRDGDEQICDQQNRKRCNSSCHQVNADCYKELEDKNPNDETLCTSPDVDLDDCGEARMSNTASRNGTSSGQASTTRSMSTPSRVFSHFRFIPGNISSRLSRASSSRLLNSCSISSSNLTMLNGGDDVVTPHSGVDGTESQVYRAIRKDSEAASGSISRSNGPSVHVSDNFQANQTISSIDTSMRDGSITRDISHLDGTDIRFSDRRIGIREPSERNVRFSRTLSVGRLRDRVLRRSSLSDFTLCPLQQQGEIRDDSEVSDGRHDQGFQTRARTAEGSHGLSSSSISRSLFGLQDRGAEALRSREARYRDLLEHRSNFLERRRRIRSQVRALRRLGSQFENVSGHDRSCILANQNQTGRCTCHVGNRHADSTDETGARASISRIVMLAEALFEVLDEIHQQSVVLSSQPSASSIGSVPAPNDIVDSLPVKPYTKSQGQRNEDTAQCYICFVEYEEGDSIRILPCHHEFHRNCVDRWLKEIHRVCPLCRGDICKNDQSPGET